MSTIEVNLLNNKYSVYIESGILNNLGSELRKHCASNRIVIITDYNVEKLYGHRITKSLKQADFEVNSIVIRPGEESKSFTYVQNIYNELLNLGFNRSDLIVAFGGGVIGDLAGFVAATLFRGVPFIQVPTSLIAQVDSSIGGKVAVNLIQGKNLVGSFYHPQAVFIDPELLKTLEKRFLYDGMAEVIKYGCIQDKRLFNRLMNFESEDELLNSFEDIIYNCCSSKRDLVERDENDKAERMMLNFGHTLGHALEKYYSYKKYTHGEAIAIGMYSITKKSEMMGITETGTTKQIYDILARYSLPSKMPVVNKNRIIEAIKYDKKNNGSNINIVLLHKIGEAFIKIIPGKNLSMYL